MSQKGHTVDPIIAKLRRADMFLGKGTNMPELCNQLEIAEPTDYRWRRTTTTSTGIGLTDPRRV